MSKRTSLFVRFFSLNLLLLLLSTILFQTCSDDNSPTEPNDKNNPTSGAISTGEVIQETSKNIGTEGGTVEVTNSDSPINGLKITVPQKGYNETRNFTISYAPITSHTLGENFNPISPMISIKNGGDYSEMPMSIKVPIKKEIGKFVIGFLYDDVTGKIEALPVTQIDDNFITVETRHFATSTISAGTELKKEMDETSFSNIVISSIDENFLTTQGVVNSGFTPGFDDWEFINYGSYISPGGHCAGQCITAMWYYSEKYLIGEPSLFHLFDNVNDKDEPRILWQDNPLGYRFASTIQEDLDFSGLGENINIQTSLQSLTWKTFVAAMVITGEPQFVGVSESDTHAGHALIAYKIDVSEGKLYIADPNYPNNRGPKGTVSFRTIDYSNGKFEPYSSYLKVGDKGTVFNQIAFFGKTAFIDWHQIGKRYEEIETELIGDDRFPDYELYYETETDYQNFTDEIIIDTIDINIVSQSTDCSQQITGTNYLQGIRAYDENTGEEVATFNSKGILPISLGKGKNNIGLEILGAKNNRHNFVDFKWITVYYQKLSIEPLSPNGVPGEESKFTALSEGTEPEGDAKYVWTFGDNTEKVTVLNDSTVSHTYAIEGTYKVTVELFENSTGKKLDEANVDFDVGEGPEITEIVDSNLLLNTLIKRYFSIPGKSIIIKGKNFKDDQKVFIDGVEIGSRFQNENETWISIMPPEIRGHVKIKIIADSGESNEFPYLFGLPIDYLSASDSLTAMFNFIPKAYDYLGEPFVEPLHLFSVGFSKNEIHWTGGIATVDIGNGDDITGAIEITFSGLENYTISGVVIDYAKTDSYSLHYEYMGHDYLGEGEDYYNGPNNNLAVYSKFFYSHNVSQLQPHSISGSIRKYNPLTKEYYDVPFYELDLSADVGWVPIPENSLSFKIFDFHVD